LVSALRREVVYEPLVGGKKKCKKVGGKKDQEKEAGKKNNRIKGISCHGRQRRVEKHCSASGFWKSCPEGWGVKFRGVLRRNSVQKKE